ncbi:MAG: sulfotransferase [Proteobacteria bacterium]|nr:sulfotransferase [Desulfobacula sp.]MBU3950946.1 sulfotransferase [Pseudomonadota bacterium]MBU4132939.1 sulfotransferase [Pseudomonadota bacterium]
MGGQKKIKIIYLLGTSFSGSTLLGYLLGASGQVFNAGELMLFSKKKQIGEISCFCGKRVEACGFWKHMGLSEYRLYTKPDLSTKILLLLKLLWNRPLSPIMKKGKWDDAKFHGQLMENMVYHDHGSSIIVDTSKSLFRLIYLICSNAYDVKIVYIKRDLMGNISSFIKNRDSFLKGFMNYKLNHFFMPLYLKRHKLDFYFLSYKNLCARPEEELKKLGRYVGVDLSYDQVIERIRERTFHVFTGSNTRVQFRDFQGIRYDESWKKRLNRFQKLVIRFIATKSER